MFLVSFVRYTFLGSSHEAIPPSIAHYDVDGPLIPQHNALSNREKERENNLPDNVR